ncbi:PAS domain-containing protein [Methyloversatilis sp.]|uniref:PAS domain-containing protein n=1 Tax=Methyloversatilis sp. TaxID=2569862 RepID=UPI0027357791|nr:PAS domain-containing protein [Methyloversatilis sp.]MDP2868793.1 PAS domain-containing protein [Methyloversatilis sp.]MDP3454903.1 PAS domain-containing protein [Methyloversatilis sp.]MDP3577959.1 PAS domain-containing protein [Methyloversatilis sp.]
MQAPLPANEASRLAALAEFDILDTPAEQSFDAITRLTADICAMPVALVSLVAGDRQWFKSAVGTDIDQTPRSVSFCAHALDSTSTLEVEDALADPRFADNPLVTSGLKIRAYAGAPLVTPGGEVLGTLCVIDWVPRRLDALQRQALRTLADQVMTQLQLRRQLQLRARTEAALHESEERWQFALAGNAQGVWDWNIETGEVFYSERWSTILDHLSSEIAPAPEAWSSRVHPDDLASAIAQRRALQNGSAPTYKAEYRMRSRDGHYIWVLDRGMVATRDRNGQALRMVGTHSDITARKTAQHQTERMAALLDEAQAIAAMGSWEFDLDSKVLTWSAQTCLLFGTAPKDFRCTFDEFLSYIVPEDRGTVAACIYEQTLAGSIVENTYRIRRPNGEIRWMYERGKVVFDGDGQPRRRLGMVMDTTERELAREALASTEKSFRKVFEDAATGIAITTPDGRFVATNAAYRRMLGYPEDELLACTLWSITHPDDLADVRALISQLQVGQRDSFVMEKRDLASNGRTVWCRMSVSMQRDTAGVPHSMIGVCEDITQQKEAESRLMQTEALLAMASRVSHLGAWIIRSPDHAMIWSDEVRRIHGLHPDETPSLDQALQFYIPEHRPLVSTAITECLNSGAPFDLEVQIVTAAGQRRWVRTTGEAVRNAAGGIVQLQGALQDVSGRKDAEHALQESRRELLTLMANLPGMVYRCLADDERTMEFVSEGVVDLTGYRPDELMGDGATHYASLIHPDDRAGVRRALLAAIQAGRPFELSYRIIARDGRERWMWERGQGVFNPEDNRTTIEGVISDVSQRRKDEEQLRLLETCVAHMGDIIVITEAEPIDAPDGPRILFVNDAFERVTGYSREEAIGRTPRFLQGPATQPEALARLRKALGEWQPVREELINYRKSGELLWLELEIVPIANDKGRYTHWVAIERDITERKRAEQALRDSEDRFRRLSRATNDAIWDWDLLYNTLWWNDGLETLFGYDRTKVEPTIESRISRIHSADVARVMESMTRVIDDGSEQWSDSYRFRRSDGSYAYVIDRAYVIRDPDGFPKRMLGGMTDITDRRQAEEELRTVASRLQHYLAVSPGVTYALAVQGNRVVPEWVSDNIEWLFGYLPEQTMARDWWVSNVHPDDLGGALPRVREALTQGHVIHEYRFRTRNGDWIWINDHMRVERDSSDVPIRIVGKWSDVTQRREAEQELTRYKTRLEELVLSRTALLEEAQRQAEAANQAKSVFLANMSHEIRTPMNGVLGMLEVLAHSPLSPKQEDMVRTARESGRILLGLIDDVLDFSKIEAGRLDIAYEPVTVSDLAENLCDALLPVAEGVMVDLSVFVDPDIPSQVLTDSVRLRQILYNLVGNAIKFSGGRKHMRGRVSLNVEVVSSDPLRLTFSIRDNGIGMPEETIVRLFTPFLQGEGSATRRFGGTGLGLSICRRLVELMGGTIAVSSAPGEGSLFTVELPFVAADEQTPHTLSDLSGVSCIVLDDALFPALLRRYLSHAGASVHSVASADEAAMRAVGCTPPVVLIRSANARNRTSALDSLDELQHVLITHGRRRRPRIAGVDAVSLDGGVLRRAALLRAVAIAAGRASPDIVSEWTARETFDAIAPLSIVDARARGELILVAEDDAINQKVILQQLELLGRTAEVASNGREAFRMWATGRYALLLTDVHMPEMDGYALLRAIRAEEAACAGDMASFRRPLPIIALTANALRSAAAQARSEGFDDYLTKPLALDMLKATLEQWMPDSELEPDRGCDTGAQGNSEIFDPVEMRRFLGNKEKTIRDLLQLFVERAGQQCRELQHHCTSGDANSVANVAHKLKSSSRSVGAMKLAGYCTDIEQAARAGGTAHLAEQLERLDNIYDRTDAAIRRYLAGAVTHQHDRTEPLN